MGRRLIIAHKIIDQILREQRRKISAGMGLLGCNSPSLPWPNCVLKDRYKIRRVADNLGFTFLSLQLHAQKAEDLPEEQQDNYEYEVNNTSRQVFNKKLEQLLREYLNLCIRMHHVLGFEQTIEFAD
ncbi:hypothetical protein JTB14_011777 [Gonioctena quinquepunctata]|nr:hypothetical protein JTB14_011777 [Gonioctena quinquepunctata]